MPPNSLYHAKTESSSFCAADNPASHTLVAAERLRHHFTAIGGKFAAMKSDELLDLAEFLEAYKPTAVGDQQ